MDSVTSRRSFLLAAGAVTAPLLHGQGAQPIRLGIVGTGNRGRAHIAVIKTMPDFQIVALADPTPQNLDQAASMVPGVKTYPDYQKMLADRKDLDAVIVVTPSFLHAEVAVAALNHGLNVLCEKPIATRIEDANRMIDASKKSGKLLYIGFQKRFVPAHAKLHELAAAGEIGKIQFISANLFRGDWNPLSWKYTDPTTGVSTNWRYLTHTQGSALLEDGIHEMDVLNWIVNGQVAHVTATGGNNLFQQRETIDHAALIVEYEGGIKLSFDFCLFGANAGPQGRRLVLIGSEGIMYPENGKIAIRKPGRGAVRYVDLVEPPATVKADRETYYQYQAFAENVRSGKPAAVGPEAGKLAVKIMLLAERSLREHRIMNWNDLPA
jgi:predicted dehydrogenase